MLVDPRGNDKTRLLDQIASWIGDDAFTDQTGPVSATDRQALSTLRPHGAAIPSYIVGANLFAPDLSDKLLWQALDAVEMSDRIKTAGGWTAGSRRASFRLAKRSA